MLNKYACKKLWYFLNFNITTTVSFIVRYGQVYKTTLMISLNPSLRERIKNVKTGLCV